MTIKEMFDNIQKINPNLSAFNMAFNLKIRMGIIIDGELYGLSSTFRDYSDFESYLERKEKEQNVRYNQNINLKALTTYDFEVNPVKYGGFNGQSDDEFPIYEKYRQTIGDVEFYSLKIILEMNRQCH